MNAGALDGFGDVVPLSETNALGHYTHRGIDGLGRVIEEKDPNNVTVRMGIDGFGRPVYTERFAYNESPQLVSTVSYDTDVVPNHVREVTRSITPTGNLTTRESIQVLNGFGDAVESWSPRSGGGFHVSGARFDAFGNAFLGTRPKGVAAFTPGGPLVDFLPTDTATEKYFDGMGVPTWAHADGSGIVRITIPEPGLTRLQDEEGHYNESKVDTHGRVVHVGEGQDPELPTTTGTMQYDAADRLVRFTDAAGDMHAYTYDGAGRLAEVTRKASNQASSTYWTYEFEGPYRKKAFENGTREVANWDHDPIGRIVSQSLYNDATSAWEDYTWDYDSYQGGVWKGAVHRTTDPAGSTRYFYDEVAPWGDLGRLTSVERDNTGGFRVIRFDYEYDFEGRTVFSSWPLDAQGPHVYSDYDAAGFKTTDQLVLNPGSNSVYFDYEYDPEWGVLTGWSSDSAAGSGWNSAEFDVVFDYASPSQQIATEVTIDNGLQTGARVDYEYRANGWLHRKTIEPPNQPGDHLEYGYDNLGRAASLMLVDGGGSQLLEAYEYDTVGNLEQMERFNANGKVETWNYDANPPFGESPKRTADISGFSELHTYDTVGRMLTWESNDPAFEDRSFAYDGLSRLREIDRGSVTTSLFYDVSDNLVYEERGTDVYERFRGYRKGPDRIVESVLPMVRVVTDITTRQQDVRIALTDLDGQALFTWDIDGTETSRELTGIYGLPVEGVAWDQGETWEVDGLHGTDEDRDNGVMHFGRRHVLFRDGMWMQPEPLLVLGGMKPLTPAISSRRYARGNPLVLADRSGFADNYQWFANDDSWFAWRMTDGANSVFYEGAAGSVEVGQAIVSGQVSPQELGSAVLVGMKTDTRSFIRRSTFIIRHPVQAYGQISRNWSAHHTGRATAELSMAVLSFGGGKIARGSLARMVNAVRRKACFTAGTGVMFAAGSIAIERVLQSDRVLAAASTDGGEEAWVKVESHADVKSAAWSPRGVCSQIARAGRKAVLPATLAACDPASAAVELPSVSPPPRSGADGWRRRYEVPWTNRPRPPQDPCYPAAS